jgi:hypothetical protein
MTHIYLLVTFGVVWLNLVGLGLLASYVWRDYAVSRIGAPLVLCLAFFFLEHFVGLGAHLYFFPISAALSCWLVWRERETLRRNLGVEAAFGVGLAYCLAWRYAFPDIDLDGERIPDLVFIHDYITGTRLPPVDRWLPPFKMNFYYSFQYYSAALMGRWFRLDANYSYQVAFCMLSGLITASIYVAVSRLCAWRPGRWIMMFAMVMGGCGLGLEADLSMSHYIQPSEMCRYLGLHRPPVERTALGRFLDSKMYPPGVTPTELPVYPLSSQFMVGEYHPPLAGLLILVFSAALVASLESEEDGRRRGVMAGLLAATVPLSMIANTWVFPLQAVLVVGWFAYRMVQGDRRQMAAGIVGAGLSTVLCYPFLIEFMRQALVRTTEFRLVKHEQHSWIGWFLVFWPVIGLIVLGIWNRERRRFVLFLACLWALLMVGTEVAYAHDINGETWERYNSTLKWWGWIYCGGALTLGAANMGSASRFCRYGSALLLLGPCAQAYNYARFYAGTFKPSLGHLEGTYWITQDVNYRNLFLSLRAKPDGICIDSGLEGSNSDATVMGVFADKQSLVGWPYQEGIWRDLQTDIGERVSQVNDFYEGKMDDPLGWLLENKVRYVLWLQKDNNNHGKQFLPLYNKLKSRYVWRHFYGDDIGWALGYWELNDAPASP